MGAKRALVFTGFFLTDMLAKASLLPSALAEVSDTAVGRFVIDGELFCIQGPFRHMAFMLSLLKASVLGTLHAGNSLERGTCLDIGFPEPFILEDGLNNDHCFPPAQLWFAEHWVDSPEYGLVPVGTLLEAQSLEQHVVKAWGERSAWPTWPDGDVNPWISVRCNCLPESEMGHEALAEGITEETCEEWSEDLIASVVPNDGASCVEGPFRYISRVHATLKSSALASLHNDTFTEGVPCAARGFGTPGAANEFDEEIHSCFPRARRVFRPENGRHVAADSEDRALASYLLQSGGTLAGFSPEAVRHCNCLPGSIDLASLSQDDSAACSSTAIRSPVLDYWPVLSM